MILNNVANDGSVIENAEFPYKNPKKDVKLLAELAEQMKHDLASYEQEVASCKDDACIEDAWKNSALAKFLKELFYTKKNSCYINKKIIDFKGIMVHAPASHVSGLATRAGFDTDGNNVDTHFIIDGDTGNVYNLLPIQYKANHCGKIKKDDRLDSFNNSMLAIDIGESSALLYKGKKDDIIMGKVLNMSQLALRKKYKNEAKSRGIQDENKVLLEYINKNKAAYLKEQKEFEKVWKEQELNTDKVAEGTKEGYTIHDNRVYYITDVDKLRADTTRSFDAAAELCAYLCIELGLNPLGKGPKGKYENYKYIEDSSVLVPNVLIAHSEGHVNFQKASNHGDPESIWEVSLRSDLTMDGFRQLVNKKMNDIQTNNIRHKMFEIIAKL